MSPKLFRQKVLLFSLFVGALISALPSTAVAQEFEDILCSKLPELRAGYDSDLEFVKDMLSGDGKSVLAQAPELEGLSSELIPGGFVASMVAECFVSGRGADPDRDLALIYLKEASARGFTEADHQLASLLVFHSESTSDHRRGVAMLQREFDGGSWYAAGKLGWAYQRGLGVQPNLSRALELYRGAAERGGTYWQYLLSHAHEMGYLGLEQSTEKAAYWRDLPKIHFDTYDCWVRNYYSNGIFPPNDKLLARFEARCADPQLRNQEIDRLLKEDSDYRERRRKSEDAPTKTQGGNGVPATSNQTLQLTLDPAAATAVAFAATASSAAEHRRYAAQQIPLCVSRRGNSPVRAGS